MPWVPIQSTAGQHRNIVLAQQLLPGTAIPMQSCCQKYPEGRKGWGESNASVHEPGKVTPHRPVTASRETLPQGSSCT